MSALSLAALTANQATIVGVSLGLAASADEILPPHEPLTKLLQKVGKIALGILILYTMPNIVTLMCCNSPLPVLNAALEGALKTGAIVLASTITKAALPLFLGNT